MKKQAIVRWGPALAVVLIGVIGILSGADAVFLGLLTVVLATLLVSLAYARRWTMFAWLPLVGFAVLTTGHVIGDEQVSFAGALMTLFLSLGHVLLEQRREKHSRLVHS
ncbi:hypothetical protein [Microbacterium sp. A93]|uniref:hypothetical protein n=1 Tax=Microbacterium sp. A93 TaxID=3450716 RepID=UPI003F42C771